ncbi:nuclear factor NF-kappa-B p100 subunit [Triplophysa rosa]|uniref:nuclear factor NF-kappa-B p100 subunit n=1 Tax=Triplophysa rosa TaxID=992332 RepID=UPI00254626C2|nr:nuclear factor NF-kappa-B p100 subunit [Triplophysa rosa]
MVSSQTRAKRRQILPESHLTGAPAANESGPNLPIPTQNPVDTSTSESSSKTGRKKQKAISENEYLGVRVKMPVRDMLRNIRIAKGIDPKDLGKQSKGSKGDKKRVNTSVNRRNCLKKMQTKGLEELAIIVEVLEEDLKSCQSYGSSNKRPSSLYHSEYEEKFWGEDSPQQDFIVKYDQENELALSPSFSAPSNNSPVYSSSSSYPSPAYNQGADVFFMNQAEYGMYETDDHRYDDQYGMSLAIEHQVPSPQKTSCVSPNREDWEVSLQNFPTWHSPQQEDGRSMTFFWAQTEREETFLNEISDQELLAADEKGRTFLHRVVEEGKRALVFVIARRMATLRKLDAKDLEGKTPLHLAAERNQHFMVSDLVSLGAHINEKDKYGKTCVHLSAENGYIRVLEVLKDFMKSGVYVNLEERDVNGLSALQCAAVALNSTVRELKLCGSAGQVRLHTLRKEQMMETLVCLLQMEYYLCALVCLDGMKRGVNSKPYEPASSQSNEMKAISNMTWKCFGYTAASSHRSCLSAK